MTLLADRVVATFALLTSFPLAREETKITTAWPPLFPLVGLALGAALLAIDQGIGWFLPTLPASAVLVLALAVLTGALHLDGLADSADGLFGGKDRGSRLRIMDDPHNGAFGFVAVALTLVLKVAAIASMEGWLRSGSLLLFPLAARTSVLWAIELAPAARPGGMGDQASRVGSVLVVLLSTVAAALASIVFFPTGGLLIVAAIAATGCVVAYAVRRIGGASGDVYGASIETSEVVVLLVAATSANSGWLA